MGQWKAEGYAASAAPWTFAPATRDRESAAIKRMAAPRRPSATGPVLRALPRLSRQRNTHKGGSSSNGWAYALPGNHYLSLE